MTIKRGRKGKYETNVKPYLEKIKKWKREGYYENQIAKLLDVAVSTFELYKTQHEELAEVLREGKEDLLADLEKTLFQRALGMEYQETKKVVEKEGEFIKEKFETTNKWLAPDVTALIFSLKNLDPQKWRDRKQIDANLNHNGFDYMTDEELRAELQRLDEE